MTWIVPEASRRPSPNVWPAADRRVMPVEGIVYHYTAGAFGGSVAWLCDRASGASAHFVISKAGEVNQLASLDDRTWHAGGTRAKPSTFLGKGAVNARTWGIELENLGPVERALLMISDEKGQRWDVYTEAQLLALERLTRELVARMPNAAAVHAAPERYLVGHEHVDPGRKRDPGPAFPWPRIYAAARAPITPVPAGGDTSALPPEGLSSPANGMCGG